MPCELGNSLRVGRTVLLPSDQELCERMNYVDSMFRNALRPGARSVPQTGESLLLLQATCNRMDWPGPVEKGTLGGK
jgi:hypothetical protein